VYVATLFLATLSTRVNHLYTRTLRMPCMLSMERALWGPSMYLPVQLLWTGTDTPTTALSSSLPRRVDQNVTPTTPTVPFGLEDHPGIALSYRVSLGTPAGRYGFPHFGRGDTPLPPPNHILRRAPGLQQLHSRPNDFGPLGTWNRRPCCWNSYWFPDTHP